jgi:hypothetical protein
MGRIIQTDFVSSMDRSRLRFAIERTPTFSTGYTGAYRMEGDP